MTVDREGIVGKRLEEIIPLLPQAVQVTGMFHAGHNMLPDPQVVIDHGDGLFLVGHPDAVAAATDMLGHADPLRIVKDRSDLDVVRVYVSKPGCWAGPSPNCRCRSFPSASATSAAATSRCWPLPISSSRPATGSSCWRRPAGSRRCARHFGDSIRGNAEFSYVSVGIGMVLGLALGALPIPVPGLGTLSLGVAAGPLIVALILGWLGRTGPIGWRMPAPANLVLRNLGLTLFLAAVAIGAGRPFVETVTGTGIPILLAGAAVLLTNVLIVLLIGYYLMRLPFDSLIGVVSGTTGNPAIPAYGSRLLQSDRVDVGYATIFPSMTIVKVVAAQITIALHAAAPG